MAVHLNHLVNLVPDLLASPRLHRGDLVFEMHAAFAATASQVQPLDVNPSARAAGIEGQFDEQTYHHKCCCPFSSGVRLDSWSRVRRSTKEKEEELVVL